MKSVCACLCTLGVLGAWPATSSAAELTGKTVTFAKDVAPIFQEKCQDCHRKGSMAPMSLVTYEETRPWAKAIKQRVVTRSMPPGCLTVLGRASLNRRKSVTQFRLW